MSRPVRLTMMTIQNKSEPMAKRRAEVLELTERAGKAGTDILLLPECADHNRTPEGAAAHEKGREAVREILGLSLDSPWLMQMAALAKKYKMVTIPCIVHNDGDKTYDAALVFGPDGSLLGSYNKTHLAPSEPKVFDYGQSLEPIQTPFGKLGILICWDMHFPEITRVYELKGAELLLWTTMRHGNFEREFYQVVLPGRCMTHCLPMGVSTMSADNQLQSRALGNSVILDAYGQTVAGGMHAGACLVQGTVDLDARPLNTRQWNVPDLVDYGRFMQMHRRTDLYGVITAPARKEM